MCGEKWAGVRGECTAQFLGWSLGASTFHLPWEVPTSLSSGFFHLSDQIRSVTQSCPTLCDPMNRSMPGLPVLPVLFFIYRMAIPIISYLIEFDFTS